MYGVDLNFVPEKNRMAELKKIRMTGKNVRKKKYDRERPKKKRMTGKNVRKKNMSAKDQKKK